MQIFVTFLITSLALVLARHPCTIIQSFSYPCQIIYVKTADNYILQVHRIAHSPQSPPSPSKRPVLLTHGLLSSSADWTFMGPQRSLAFQLADLNYDVWMANARGNSFSLNHTKLNPKNGRDKAAFFDFSWHEIGYYDYPAVIDHILAETKNGNLHFVGYSQGATSFLVLTATRPEYSSKFASVTMMAPGVFMGHQEWLRPIVTVVDQLLALLNRIGIYDVPLVELISNAILKGACQNDVFQGLCTFVVALNSGVSKNVFWESDVMLWAENFPSSASLKQLVHYAQLIQSRTEFLMYNYGPRKNMRVYGQAKAPSYNLEKIKVPIAVFYGRTDFLANFYDVKRLISKLPNVVKNYPVPLDTFSHFDFVLHRNVTDLVYKPIIEHIREFKQNEIQNNN